MLFELGKVVATPGSLRLLVETDRAPAEYLDRHVEGDWGDVDRDDDLANFRAAKFGDRILSAYQVNGEAQLWVITEADRSVTTLLLPEEY